MKKRFGCIRFVFLVFIALTLLYFCIGDGKTVLMKKIYPIEYQEYVEEYANEYSLDKNLVYAVIKIESGFDENAVSRAGAKGLMQLMDNTAKECTEKGGFGYSIPEDLFDGERNIRMGCYYIKHLFDMYGNIETALAAYNGGIGNVEKWLSDPTLSDGNGGLRKIPYKETERYVKKVIKTFELYNKLYKTNE